MKSALRIAALTILISIGLVAGAQTPTNETVTFTGTTTTGPFQTVQPVDQYAAGGHVHTFGEAATAQATTDTAPTLQLNIGSAGFGCGRQSTPTYCYGIPVAASDDDGITHGSLWLYQGTTIPGFIQFSSGFEGLGQATITSSFIPLNTLGGTLSYSFTGYDSENQRPYTGTLVLTYTEFFSKGGGGRPGGAGYRWIVTGGGITLNE